MGAHSAPERFEPDAGNTDPNDLTEELDPAELAELLSRFNASGRPLPEQFFAADDTSLPEPFMRPDGDLL